MEQQAPVIVYLVIGFIVVVFALCAAGSLFGKKEY
jgi:septation ring formation regulator EzrA